MISQPTNSGGSEGALIPSRLPIVPSDGDNYLGSGDGGRPSWKKMPPATSGLPSGATAKQFDVCENGEPTQYWFLTWEEEPNIS